MGDTCFQCVMGEQNVMAGAPAAGEGFGTCYECWVHACPRHGDRSLQYFRCADCIAAKAASSALTEPVRGDPKRVLAEAPRMAVLSAGLRERFNPDRMGAAIRWVHGRAREDATLLPGTDEGIEMDREENAAAALGFSQDEVRAGPANEELSLRAALVEREVRDLVVAAEAASEELDDAETRRGAGQTAAVSLGIAYMARGAESPETSPFELSGGLLLPASVVVLGHAYSVANALFW